MTRNSRPNLAVHANGLARRKGGRLLFENVSFAAADGDCIEITGPNGSGKSTLLRVLAGIESPDAGTSELPEDSLAYLGHGDGLKPDLTVSDNISYWSGIHGRRCEERLIDQFKLADLQDLRLRQLSAGQRKRVALVSLMSSGARVWLLDEPATSLDPDWAKRTLSIIADHCANGGIAVLTTLSKSVPQAATVDLGSASDATNTTGKLP